MTKESMMGEQISPYQYAYRAMLLDTERNQALIAEGLKEGDTIIIETIKPINLCSEHQVTTVRINGKEFNCYKERFQILEELHLEKIYSEDD